MTSPLGKTSHKPDYSGQGNKPIKESGKISFRAIYTKLSDSLEKIVIRQLGKNKK